MLPEIIIKHVKNIKIDKSYLFLLNTNMKTIRRLEKYLEILVMY